MTSLLPLLLLFATTTVAAQIVLPAPSTSAGMFSALQGAENTRSVENMRYVENRGQWGAVPRFLMQGQGYDLWVTDDELVYDIHSYSRRDDGDHRSGVVVRMEFVGAAGDGVEGGVEPLPELRNYLRGNDPSDRIPNVRSFQRAVVRHLYSGIDMQLSTEGGEPRYDLLVAPGADPSRIIMRYAGAESVGVEENGDLAVRTAVGVVHHRHPIAWQVTGGVRRPVDVAFHRVNDGTIRLNVGDYDRTEPLVVDPVISSRVFSGGIRDGANDMVIDGNGWAYLCGWSYSPLYPTTAGAYDVSLNNDSTRADAVVMKVNTAGMAIVWSTFIGGSARDVAEGVWVNRATGGVTVCGQTASPNFPTSPDGRQRTGGGGSDAFVLRLAPDGASLLYGTYLGGTREEGATAVLEDGNGRIALAGWTESADFPVTGFDRQFGSAEAPYYTDAFAATLDPGTGAYSATYIGGSGTDRATDIALTRDNASVVIVGGTWSADFPTTAGAFVVIPPATRGQDAFVATMPLDLAALRYSTTLGGRGVDMAHALRITPGGSILLVGETVSRDFPATHPFDSFHVRTSSPDLFVVELDPSRRDSMGRPVMASSVIGGRGSDVANDVMEGPDGRLWITGITASNNFPFTPDAYQRTHTDSVSYDLFLMSLDSGKHTLRYSTYMGGSGDELGNALAIDNGGILYLAGATGSNNYPITDGSYSLDAPGKTAAFLTRFTSVAGVALPVTHRREAGPIAVETGQGSGGLELRLQSADGRPHTVRATLHDLRGALVADVTETVMIEGSGERRIVPTVSGNGAYLLRLVADNTTVLTYPIVIAR